MSLEFVPRGPINNIPTLAQVMAWCRPGYKPLSEPVMIRVPTHIYASLGLNELRRTFHASRRLFHAPTRTTSSGFLVLHSEAIRDVKQTTLRELTAFRINE